MKKLLLLLLLPICGWAAAEEAMAVYHVRVEASVSTEVDGEQKKSSMAVTKLLSEDDRSNLAAFRNMVKNIPCGGDETWGAFVANNKFEEWEIFVGSSALKTDDDLVRALGGCETYTATNGQTIKLLNCEVKPRPLSRDHCPAYFQGHGFFGAFPRPS